MDKVTRGMSESGKHPEQCCQKSDAKDRGIVEKVKDLAKETTAKVKDFLHRSKTKR